MGEPSDLFGAHGSSDHFGAHGFDLFGAHGFRLYLLQGLCGRLGGALGSGWSIGETPAKSRFLLLWPGDFSLLGGDFEGVGAGRLHL